MSEYKPDLVHLLAEELAQYYHDQAVQLDPGAQQYLAETLSNLMYDTLQLEGVTKEMLLDVPRLTSVLEMNPTLIALPTHEPDLEEWLARRPRKPQDLELWRQELDGFWQARAWEEGE